MRLTTMRRCGSVPVGWGLCVMLLVVVCEAVLVPEQPCSWPVSCELSQQLPVCATDGRTYSSLCQLLATTSCADTSRPRVVHWGACRTAGGRSRRAILHVECHRDSDYCWCVDRLGNPVSGSAVKNDTPDCSRHAAQFSKAPRNSDDRPRRRCNSRLKAVLSNNLLRIFRLQYNRRHMRILTRSGPPKDPERAAAVWKFRELDVDRDRRLSRGELRALRKHVRKTVEPSGCARRFPRFCDADRSGDLKRQEWLRCVLGSARRRGGGKRGGGAAAGGRQDGNGTAAAVRVRPSFGIPLRADDASAEMAALRRQQDEQQPAGCVRDRQQARLNQRLAQTQGRQVSFFIPQCSDDNLFRPVQCHNSTGYCWCTDPETGRSVDGSSVQGRRPDDCAARLADSARASAAAASSESTVGPAAARRSRMSKPCRAPADWQQFLRQLFDHLTDAFVQALMSGRYALPASSRATFEEKIARWKFVDLDRNGNGILERSEWKSLRTELAAIGAEGRYPLVSACGRRLPVYCNVNGDRLLALDEWLSCVGTANDSQVTVQPKNPLEKYLISE